MYQDKQAAVFERKVKVFKDVYNSTRKSYSKITKLLYDEIINTPEVIDLFKQAKDASTEEQQIIRNALYQLLTPTYTSLKTINIRQLHFHLPNVSSFLRFHKPEKYGDSLLGIRYSLEIANTEKRYVEGFEEGRIYNGFRYVYPLFDEEKRHIGSVETSLSFKALSNDIEETLGDEIDFILKKSIVEKKVWKSEQSNYIISQINSEYMNENVNEYTPILSKYKHINQSISQEATRQMKKQVGFAICKDNTIITFIPIGNVQGDKNAAYLISYEKSEEVRTIMNDALVLLAISTIILLIVSILIFVILQKIAKITEIATYDSLTGAYNRSTMNELLVYELERSKRKNKTLSIIFLDIDDFKSVNDRYGHEQGDLVLKKVVELMGEKLRKSDRLGRWGGEEFLVMLPETNGEEAVLVAEKLREVISMDEYRIPSIVTCSFGVATCVNDDNLESMIARADACLYKAKKEGKNRVVSHL
ncbi:diguanylate cyclase [Sulfurovum sp. XGS-02]|uniref:sensor domain-containing diguanylate cyclase n=1 Tax=Sulfurovum sp. XGS-02 TaxID=2925411 RepID=UPI00204F78A8|nr:diguanylate cyclase [Sulfurovum sp. XGS-02]UPT77433.1 diguanylate cyclase [Sulfurovum sp. XGS-02]